MGPISSTFPHVVPIDSNAWGRPVVDATLQEEFGKFRQTVLIDTGATLYLICTKAVPKIKEFQVQEVKF